MKKVIILSLALLAVLQSCEKDKKKSCGETRQDYTVLTFFGNNAYPDLPSNVLVNGAWGRLGYYITDGNITSTSYYELENEEFKINGTVQDDWSNPKGLQLGMNTISFKADCNLPNAENEFVCDCASGVSPVTEQVEVVDTVRLWIKKIEFRKQYPKTHDFGSHPDVYLKITNFNLKSNVTGNYDLATMGNIIWNIDDTITISDKYFNMEIESWDDDWPTKDEKLQSWSIKAADVSNWSTGSHSYYNVGGFDFEIVRL